MVRLSIWIKFLSKLIRVYHRWSPIQRGKHRLLCSASPFLVAPVGADLWVRVTGASGFEQKALRGDTGEVATVALFKSLLSSGMIVFDVGANIGYFSLLAARAIGPKGQVHAFEASPIVAKRLAENVELNGIKNALVNHNAISDRVCEVELRLQEDDSEGNSLVSYEPTWPVARVASITLDSYIAERQIGKVDILKIDVEGAEEMVVAGAAKMLSRRDPPIIIFESNPVALRRAASSPESLCAKFTSFGYKCYLIEKLTSTPESVWNYLAVHSTCDQRAVTKAIEAMTLVAS